MTFETLHAALALLKGFVSSSIYIQVLSLTDVAEHVYHSTLP